MWTTGLPYSCTCGRSSETHTTHSEDEVCPLCGLGDEKAPTLGEQLRAIADRAELDYGLALSQETTDRWALACEVGGAPELGAELRRLLPGSVGGAS